MTVTTLGYLTRQALVRFVAAFALLVLASAPVFAGPDQEEAELNELQTKVSLDADDAFLPTVLSILAEKSNYNIVTSPEVRELKRISIHLKDTPIEEAIELAVRAAGLSYEKVGKSFLIGNRKALQTQTGTSPEMFQLKNTNYAKIASFLKPLAEDVQVDETGKYILVNASAKARADVRYVIESMDRPHRAVHLKVKIFEVTNKDEAQYGIDWSKLGSVSFKLEETSYPTGSDVPYLPNAGQPSETEFLNRQRPYVAFSGFTDDPGLEYRGFWNHWSRQVNAFDITLDFLVTERQAKILSNAALVVMDRHPAEMNVVDVYTYVSTGGEFQQIQTKTEEFGTKVTMTPTINDDQFVTLSLYAESSNIIELVDDRIPHILRRSVSTTLRVKSGQSYPISGLLSEQYREKVDRFPLLSEIPFLGWWLFTHKEPAREQVDLIIHITPHIVSSDGIIINGKSITGDTMEEHLESIEEAKGE